MNLSESIPQYVRNLIAFYRSYRRLYYKFYNPAVFYEKVEPGTDLDQVALRYYSYFNGESWERFGADFWLERWQFVYQRPRDRQPDIVSELNEIVYETCYTTDGYDGLLGFSPESQLKKTQKVLSPVFDTPEVTDLRMYRTGRPVDIIKGVLGLSYRLNAATTILAFDRS
jgi:hypothetical protein